MVYTNTQDTYSHCNNNVLYLCEPIISYYNCLPVIVNVCVSTFSINNIVYWPRE